MFLHCTKLTLDHWPLHILDPLALKHLTYQGAVYYTIKMNVPKLVRYQVPCIRKLRPYASSTLVSISLRNRHIHSTIDWSLKVEFEWIRWLSIDPWPLYILDPLPSKQHLNGWHDSPLYKIDPPHLTLEICAGNIRPTITDCCHAQEISAPWSQIDAMRWNSSHLWYTPSSSSMSHHGWCVVDAMKLLLVQSY